MQFYCSENNLFQVHQLLIEDNVCGGIIGLKILHAERGFVCLFVLGRNAHGFHDLLLVGFFCAQTLL